MKEYGIAVRTFNREREAPADPRWTIFADEYSAPRIVQD